MVAEKGPAHIHQLSAPNLHELCCLCGSDLTRLSIFSVVVRRFIEGTALMNTATLELPEVATRAEWLATRLKLLAKEKELTHARDALNAERRRLPMVKIEKDYVFEGPEGKVRLLDLFEDRLQLVIYHFMWLWDAGKPRDKGCPSCSAWADEIARGDLAHLHERTTTLALVSRAPLPSSTPLKSGWDGKCPGIRPSAAILIMTLASQWTNQSPRWSTTIAPRLSMNEPEQPITSEVNSPSTYQD